jgi:membrane-associated phospholipid phosphatase
MGCICIGANPASAQHYSLDNQVLYEMMEHRSSGGTQYNKFLSNTTSYVSLAVPATILAIGAIKGDKLTLQKGLYITESIAASALVTYGLKSIVKRQRPFLSHPELIPAESATSASFPSGHTSMAFATATSLSIAYPKWYVIVPAYLWAGSVGYSRMYLGVHYPTDVAAGALVGAGSAWLTYKANQWLQGKKKPARVRTVY